MVHYTVRCDPLPGKEDELDRFLRDRAKTFWLSKEGVTNFHVYGDALVGWPERIIDIEVRDLSALQGILNSDDRRRLRHDFMGYCSRVESQILETLV
ncbi:MAG: hypothetical protein HYY05_03785 [Chloroflexi bacterium]|nr:hypothetical protein [Chloroflexota bacterium]